MPQDYVRPLHIVLAFWVTCMRCYVHVRIVVVVVEQLAPYNMLWLRPWELHISLRNPKHADCA